ncbi:MAG: glycine--tRNA ligase, partial [Streptosporangiaceae bacterium]
MNTSQPAPMMQDAILILQKYWTERGCMIVQPFNTEVGAGTANPATALRVLGPEPWRVAYVEPSVRPDDSRYGENPNRLQTHTQFQVILKPDPGNPQELYLGSLQALGVDLRRHDVRFVEDNWNSPALAAWGLGWEVWLDGLEITQFTYFQQAAGVALDPVSVEITYGLERILMALQEVSHFRDIMFAPGITYGEVFAQAEYEMSRYYLDDADVAANQQLFDLYAAEAQRMLDLRLPFPAYVSVLKCSHTFNVLDARGAISTTERARAFGLMRRLTREAGTLWVERRTELGHPLGVWVPPAKATVAAPLPEVGSASTLLFEIGVEELPHRDVAGTADAVHRAVTAKLAATRLSCGETTVHGTPRRIVVTVAGVAPREEDTAATVRGPRVGAAYDADKQPTKALLGFVNRHGVAVTDVQVGNFGGHDHVTVVKTEAGRSAVAVLSALLAEVVSELRAERNMRWRDPDLAFSRPVRWLVARLAATAVPVAVSALASGTTTRVYRTAEPPEIEVPQADGYPELLEAHGIILDRGRRREMTVRAVQELASDAGGTVDIEHEEALIDEITDLVEYPAPILGSFAEHYLELPASVLTTVMRKHQRYLPVFRDGQLTQHFVAVANGDCDHDLVRRGNEAVLRARYEDALFFWRADLAVTPDEFRKRLDRLTFEERLGSVANRADRISALASGFAERAGLPDQVLATVRRAGELAKFDLASQLAVELSSLAGVMASEYALRAGEDPAVARALAEMEMPRSGGGALPGSQAGTVLSLADRFDLLTGMFIINAVPTGRSDPFGVRRAAIGIVNVLRAFPELAAVSVRYGIEQAAARYAQQGIEVPPGCLAAAAELVARRYEQQLSDAAEEHRLIQAVLPFAGRPAHADALLSTLRQRAAEPGFLALAEALQRVIRILPDELPAPADPARLALPAEVALASVTGDVTKAMR